MNDYGATTMNDTTSGGASVPMTQAAAVSAGGRGRAPVDERLVAERRPLGEYGRVGGFLLGTLGPSGTSSEHAAEALIELLRQREHLRCDLVLYQTFEHAARAVRRREASALLVPNAYQHANRFYMDPELDTAAAFIAPTPRYGLAMLAGRPVPVELRVATHPAAVPLLDHLVPDGHRVREILTSVSTSAAADTAARGAVDAALTNQISVERHNLRFFSRTQELPMVWSVFVKAGPLAGVLRAAEG
jgi:hypothetical protein